MNNDTLHGLVYARHTHDDVRVTDWFTLFTCLLMEGDAYDGDVYDVSTQWSTGLWVID